GLGAQAADFYLRTGYMPLEDPHKEPRRSRVLFSQRELQALIAYVASLKQGPAVPTPHPARGNLAEGLKQFTEHCAGCHQVAAAGGYVTNAVAPALDNATPVQIAEAARIGPYFMPRFSKRQITNAQLDSIIRYVTYAKHPDDRGSWALGHLGPVPEGLVTWFIGIAAIPHQTQFLGLALGLAFAFIAAACVVIAKRLVVAEELEEDYGLPARPEEEDAVARIVEESGDRFTRKRLLLLAGAGAGTALGAALITPAVSLGPVLDVSSLYRTPWRRGVRLVDEAGRGFRADEI